jgi:hypothetical protein
VEAVAPAFVLLDVLPQDRRSEARGVAALLSVSAATERYAPEDSTLA